MLKGTLRWSQNLLDDEEININYNHYKEISTSESLSTDSSPDAPVAQVAANTRGDSSGAAEKRLFYVSSEENSEVVDSPGDMSNQMTQNKVFKLPTKIEVELEELKSSLSKRMGSRRGNGPNCESEFSKSWSPDTDTTDTSPDTDECPNPLYRIRHSSYDT